MGGGEIDRPGVSGPRGGLSEPCRPEWDVETSTQTRRQEARRDARTVTAERRAALLNQAKRLEELAARVMTAVGDRDGSSNIGAVIWAGAERTDPSRGVDCVEPSSGAAITSACERRHDSVGLLVNLRRTRDRDYGTQDNASVGRLAPWNIVRGGMSDRRNTG